MRIMLPLLVLLTIVFSQPGTDAQKTLNVAVSKLEGRGLSEEESGTLTDALSNHLANLPAYKVMERGRMDLVLKEQGFQHSGACNDAACVVEMGQLLGVDHMVTGSIGKVGQTYSINLRMIHVGTGQIVRSVNNYYKGEIDGVLVEALPLAVRELSGTSAAEAPVAASPMPMPKIESRPAAKTFEPAPKTPSPDYFNRFGVGLLYRNIFGEANFQGGNADTGKGGLGIMGATLNLRLFNHLLLKGGITTQGLTLKLPGTLNPVHYRASISSPIFTNGGLNVSLEADALGFLFGAGFVFDIGKRANLSIVGDIQTFEANILGILDLPNSPFGTLVPNVYGHQDPNSPDNYSTILVYTAQVRLEGFLLSRLSLTVSGGYTFADETWDYSTGYREWVGSLITLQPEKAASFSINAFSADVGLNFYFK